MSPHLPEPPRTRPRLSPTAVLRREWYLLTLQAALDDSGYPSGKRTMLVHQLRADLSEDAASRGMTLAVADLGPAGELARSYVDLEEGYRARWSRGFAGALLLWLACFVTRMIFALGLAAGARSAGQVVSGSFLGAVVEASPDPLSITISPTSPAVLLVGGALFVLLAVPWRSIPAVRRRHARRTA